VWRNLVLACALALTACAGEPAPEHSPVAGPTATSPASPSPTSTAPFVSTADCEDATVGEAEVELVMEDNAFVPECAILLGGQSFLLRNEGANIHSFNIEGTNVEIIVEPRMTRTTPPVGQVVTPGTYRFYCLYHRDQGMDGDLTVTAAG
jgi:plastocyanin